MVTEANLIFKGKIILKRKPKILIKNYDDELSKNK